MAQEIKVAKILTRTGLKASLPQPLSPGEFGTALDTGEVFIGLNPANTAANNALPIIDCYASVVDSQTYANQLISTYLFQIDLTDPNITNAEIDLANDDNLIIGFTRRYVKVAGRLYISYEYKYTGSVLDIPVLPDTGLGTELVLSIATGASFVNNTFDLSLLGTYTWQDTSAIASLMNFAFTPSSGLKSGLVNVRQNLRLLTESDLVSIQTENVPVISVNGIKNLQTITSVQYTTGIYGDNTGIDGHFIWSPSTDKSLHNGGTIIAPEAVEDWDGSQADIGTLLNWSGTGVGCWLRVCNIAEGIHASWFGMTVARNGNIVNDLPDVTESLRSALVYCNSLYEEITGSGYFGAVNIKLILPSGFCKTSSVLPFLRGTDIESQGTTHFQCSVNKAHGFMDCGTGKVVDFKFTGLKFQQYTTCFRMKSDDSDMTKWVFSRCSFRNVDLGIDTVSYVASRSSILTLHDIKVSYGVSRLVNSYCDLTIVEGGWFSHNVNNALIMFVGRISVTGGIYVPVLPTPATSFCWYQAELSDRTGGGEFSGCRFGAEYGGGVVLYIKSNAGSSTGDGLSTGNTQRFHFSGCQLSSNNVFNPDAVANTVRGIVVFKAFNNGGVSFESCTISTDLGPASSAANLSRVVVEYGSLDTTLAPNNFVIEFDESTFRAAMNGSNRIASNNLLQYVGNSKYQSIYRGISASGSLIVGLTTDATKNKATFKVVLGPSATNYGHPLRFNLDLGQLGSSTNNAYRNSRYAGYACSIVGGRNSSTSLNVYKIVTTLIYSHVGGNGLDKKSEIVSFHFGTGDTGATELNASGIEPNGTVDVTVVWGELAHSADTGIAVLTPVLNQYSRRLNGNNL